jgi:hypothetical protein
MNVKSEIKALTEAYTKIYEMEVNGEPEDHKQRMINLVSEIAGIAQRIIQSDLRPEDGERLMELAKDIESEYKE